jgi:hypothetical protein
MVERRYSSMCTRWVFNGQFHTEPFEPPNLSERRLLPGQSVDVEKNWWRNRHPFP